VVGGTLTAEFPGDGDWPTTAAQPTGANPAVAASSATASENFTHEKRDDG